MKLKEPVWYKQYCRDLTRIYGLQKAGNDIMMYILANMDTDNHITILGGATNKMILSIAKKDNSGNTRLMARQTAYNNLTKLVSAGLLALDGHGVYVANPYIFTKKENWGSTLNMQRKFRAMFEYSAGNRKISGKWIK